MKRPNRKFGQAVVDPDIISDSSSICVLITTSVIHFYLIHARCVVHYRLLNGFASGILCYTRVPIKSSLYFGLKSEREQG